MNNHFFSIIICCYNSAKYLEKTILSVVNQNYTNWELILIDNGSTDKTESIINKYIETNKKISLYKEKNIGLSNARNKGLDKSNSDWVVLLDHDDIMSPNRLIFHNQDINNNKNINLFFGDARIFDESGFFWVNTPIITSTDCEGAGDMFRVSTLDQVNRQQTDFTDDFFGSETFLTVSGQLNLESYACALKKVYTFGPTFRAENSNTSRHLAEFWMIEPEIAFADLKANAVLAESLLKTVFQETLKHSQEDLNFFNDQINSEVIERLEKIVNSNFASMTYTDAIKALKDSNKKFDFEVSWGADLQSEHERFLTEEVIGGPLVVTDYPKEIKAFYMRLNDDEKTVAAMDILVPGVGEIVGGSQREERLAVLDQRIEDETLRKELWWYRDLRRYGTVPHAGFGLGFERLVQYVSGMDNIRNTIPFPRVPKNASF